MEKRNNPADSEHELTPGQLRRVQEIQAQEEILRGSASDNGYLLVSPQRSYNIEHQTPEICMDEVAAIMPPAPRIDVGMDRDDFDVDDETEGPSWPAPPLLFF